MIKSLLLALRVSLVYLFAGTSHPLALGLILLAQTFCIALLSGLTTHTFWLRYVLFLVFLGGLLVLFLYVTSLARNELFSPNPSLWGIAIVIFSGVTWGLTAPRPFLQASFPSLSLPLSNPGLTPSSFSSFLSLFYSPPTLGVTLGLAWYLLLALLVVIKLVNAKAGPLRPLA